MYYIVYGFLYLLSLLPLKILYLLSDLLYFIIYYLIRYRKKVVSNNLAIAFPHKTSEERSAITKKFYKNFTDSFIESIKLFSADSKFINEHFVSDYTLFNILQQQGKKCQLHLGHNFNWEIANLALPLHMKQKMLTVYMPLSKTFERLFIKLRSRTGCILLPATQMRTAIIPFRKEEYVLVLVADQSPPFPTTGIWVNFFGRPTPFIKGPESGARIANLPVIFCHFTKKKRGYYECHTLLAEENPASLKKGELTKKYALFLEEKMTAHPEMWLWSHKRWKWEWKEEYGAVYT